MANITVSTDTDSYIQSRMFIVVEFPLPFNVNNTNNHNEL